MIEVTTQLTEEIFQAYYSFSLFRSKNIKLRKAITMVLLPVFSVTIILMTFIQKGSVLGYVVGGLGLALFAGHLYMLGPGMRSQYQSLPESLKGPQRLCFGEETIDASCEWDGQLQESSYVYKKVAVQETEDAVYIFVADGQALLLSKSQLADDITAIITLLKEKLPESQYMICYKYAKKRGKVDA